ncbi:MAG TPA: hypothetical protein GXX36_00155 [Clostridiaceae bacterium]|nr:hypothetical protein [Clostridiaceae bacterium]
MLKRILCSMLIILVLFAYLSVTPSFASSTNPIIDANSIYKLIDGWEIQSSDLVGTDGKLISTNRYIPQGWYSTSVPNTVLGALINAGEYGDVFFGDNVAKIGRDRFESPWWYRKAFILSEKEQGKRILLNFNGINYQADVWVNGNLVANKDEVVGTFRTFEFDITDYVICDGVTQNVVAVCVTKPEYGKDLAIYWVDWCPQPADSNMGLWRDVYIATCSSVSVRNPFVTAKVDKDLSTAHLNAYVELSNHTNDNISGKLEATIKSPAGTEIATISQPVAIRAGVKDMEVAFKAEDFDALNISNPELWWPLYMGSQPMYSIEFKFMVNDKVSDKITQKFGIREIYTEFNISPSSKQSLKDMVQFYINHKPLLVRAGGYCPTDLFLRHSSEANRSVIEYCKEMGLNAIRDEGKFWSDELLDLLDENGIMLISGWCCCDRWQQSHQWDEREMWIGTESLKSQLRLLRVHPSMLAWMNGSDNPPSYDTNPATKQRGIEVEQRFFDIEHEAHWEDFAAIISSGSAKIAQINGTYSGMHMDATYDYAPPAYFFEDMNDGGAFGFTSEAGPGPNIPVIETLKKIIPEENLWPYNIGGENYSLWNYHAARGSFANLKVFNMALDNHFGKQSSLEEYVMKAHVQMYDAQRAQFEALNANKYVKASGWVQWMLNNAWPSIYWNLFDYYMNPHGGYFGAKKANEPLHIMYDYASKEVKVINNTFNEYEGLKAKIGVFCLDSTCVYSKEIDDINIEADGASSSVGGSPKTIGYQEINFNGRIEEAYGVKIIDELDVDNSLADILTSTYFIRLELLDSENNLVSVNSYAYSKKKDMPRYQNHSWNVTLQDQYADFTDLQLLEPVDLEIVGTPTVKNQGKEQILTYTIKNNGDSIAYSVFAKVRKGYNGDLIAPIKMEDNYFMLLPGEERTIQAKYYLSDLDGATPVIEVNCYNNICTTKQNPAPSTLDLARGATAKASSYQGSNRADRAIDGSDYTKWQSSTSPSTGADPQWFQVDFDEPTTFNRVIIRWDYLFYAKNIEIQVSDDEINWETVYKGSNDTGFSVDDVMFAPVTKQHVRLTMSGKRPAAPAIGGGRNLGGIDAVAEANSFSICSFEVYNENIDNVDIPDKPAAPQVIGTTATTALLHWDGAIGSYYELYRREGNPIGEYDLIYTGNSINYTDIGLNPESVYWYKLKVVNAAGSSNFSDVSNAAFTKELKGITTAVALPADGEVKISWIDPKGNDVKTIKIIWNEMDEPVLINRGVQSATISGLENGKIYTFKLIALDGNGNESKEVFEVSARPLADSIAQLSGPMFIRSGDNCILELDLVNVNPKTNAADITIKYDSELYSLLNVEPKDNVGSTFIDFKDDRAKGTVKIIAVNLGENGMPKDLPFVKLIFMTDNVNKDFSTEFAVIDAKMSGVDEDDNVFKYDVIGGRWTVEIRTKVPGDVNGDDLINIEDLSLIAKYYGTRQSDANWNIAKFADINEDGVIDIADIAFVARKILNQ